MTRITAALLALSCLTAFAPAPFPKSAGREGAGGISLRSVQGAWKVAGIESVVKGRGKVPARWQITHVQVAGDRFSYLLADGFRVGTDRVAIDPTKNPATVDFRLLDRPNEPPYRVGLIKRDGGRVVILYYQTGPEDRPKSFENPPAGWWWLTLERVR